MESSVLKFSISASFPTLRGRKNRLSRSRGCSPTGDEGTVGTRRLSDASSGEVSPIGTCFGPISSSVGGGVASSILIGGDTGSNGSSNTILSVRTKGGMSELDSLDSLALSSSQLVTPLTINTVVGSVCLVELGELTSGELLIGVYLPRAAVGRGGRILTGDPSFTPLTGVESAAAG